MKLVKNPKIDPQQIYAEIANKLYRMSLIHDPLDLDEFFNKPTTPELLSELDNHLTQAILPKINQLLDRSLFEVYRILYDIDVSEQYIKEQIMSVKNTQMIPSLIAFAIIDRLKIRYQNHQLMGMACLPPRARRSRL